MHATQARIALARGDAAAAIQEARQAEALFSRNSIAPDVSADVGQALLLRAQAEATRGDADASAATAARADEIMRRALQN